MFILKILRFILPPFHPWKEKWIKYYFGPQSHDGAWKDFNKNNIKSTIDPITNKIKENEE